MICTIGNLELSFTPVNTWYGGLNQSIQIGDTAYYTNYNMSGEFAVGNANLIEIGSVVDIIDNTICCQMDPATTPPTDQSFIFFSKDNQANLSSVIGYYGEAVFKNDSKEKAELFATACEVVESSK